MTRWQALKRLIAAPFIGLAFCVFLPFIGFAMLFYYIAMAIIGHTKKLVDRRVESV